ncbi:MAG: hypothetical protein K2L87_00185 [Clostridiales bacterium]|nr:hypothetical protein [Clostridiales bacterium]
MRYTIENTFGAEIKRGFASRAYLYAEGENAFCLQNKFAGFGKKFLLTNVSGESVAVLRRGVFPFLSKWRIQSEGSTLTLKWKGKMTLDVYFAENGWRVESVPKTNERTYVVKDGEEEIASLVYGKKEVRVETDSFLALLMLLAVSICADW